MLIDGEFQSHVFKNDDGISRNIVEIKARRIQFLNKKGILSDVAPAGAAHPQQHDEEPTTVEDDSFDKFLTSEESQLLKEDSQTHTQGT